MSEALITTHDGIVGSWRDPVGNVGQIAAEPANATVDQQGALALWSRDVRSSVFTFDLLEPVSIHPKGEVCELHVATAGGPHILVTLKRPSEKAFRAQAKWVAGYADLRGDRLAEILAQTTDITSFPGAIALTHPERTARTIELLELLISVTSTITLRMKHALASRRPAEYSPQVQPIIQTPAHSAFPQGHATQAFMQATVLSALIRPTEEAAFGADKPIWRTMLFRQALRTTINRVVAGVHFPLDGAAGAVLGVALGRYYLQRLGVKDVKGSGCSWSFDWGDTEGDIDWPHMLKVLHEATNQSEIPYVQVKASAKVGAPVGGTTPGWLWDRALKEWPAAAGGQ